MRYLIALMRKIPQIQQLPQSRLYCPTNRKRLKTMHFHEYDLWARLVQANAAWKRLPGFTADEKSELEYWLSTLYGHICVYHGDPLRRGHPKHTYVEDALQEPVPALKSTILDIGLGYIDAVLIGPVDLAIEILAADPRLMAAARSRAFCGSVGDAWIGHVGQVVSLVDAHSARRAMEGVL